MHADPSTRTFTQDYLVENDGTLAETITDASVHVAGVKVLSTNTTVPITVAPHRWKAVDFRFTVTNCQIAPSGPLPVRLVIHNWAHTAEITLQDHGGPYPDARVACER